MNVGQLRRLLRALPDGTSVLLEGVAGPYETLPSDFRVMGFRGRWGPRALVITPVAPVLRRHGRRPKDFVRPIDRVRARQSMVWLG